MSENSASKARLAQLVPARGENPRQLSYEDQLVLLLRRTGPLDRPVSVVNRLKEVHVSLRAGHHTINNLAARGWAICTVDRKSNISELARDLASMNVQVRRRINSSSGDSDISRFRTERGLTQREFADLMGIDVRTLQNWEQGRNRPDPAVLSLMRIFAHAPEVFEEALSEPVLG